MYVHLMSQAVECRIAWNSNVMRHRFLVSYKAAGSYGDPIYRMSIGKGFFFENKETSLTTDTLKITLNSL